MATKQRKTAAAPAPATPKNPGPTVMLYGLRRVRRSQDLSARALSKLLRERGVDVSEDAIYWWEGAKGPCRGIFVAALAEVLACSPAELTQESLPRTAPSSSRGGRA